MPKSITKLTFYHDDNMSESSGTFPVTLVDIEPNKSLARKSMRVAASIHLRILYLGNSKV